MRLRWITPVVVVGLGSAAIVSQATATTVPTDSSSPSESTAASDSTVPSESTEAESSAAREQWLEFAEDADPESFAGGAELRDLVDGQRVLMIGDSIMASTSSRYGGEMCNELVSRGWQVEMNAESGRFVDFGDRVLDSRLDDDWDVAVVMLGNNYGADKAVFKDHLDDIVERLAPRPTVLLTVTEFRPDRVDVNDAIYEIAAEHDNVRVVDWAAETAADPGLVGGDGLHLSNLGRVRYADLVGRELGRAPAAGEGHCLGSDFTDDSAVTGTQPGQVTMPPSTWPSNPSGGGEGGGGTPQPTQAPAPVETQPPVTVTQPAPTTAPIVTPPPPTQATPPPTAAPTAPPAATTAAPQPTTGPSTP